MKEPIISLCLPTNGVIEWVFPVLDSIYAQNVDQNLYEIIVTNNGNNEEFENKLLHYQTNHTNIIYKKTTAFMFYNQLEALKLANGKYLKFINHRGLFTEGALRNMIELVCDNETTKPVIFFGNGVLKEKQYELENFDDFVSTIGHLASWTTGVGIWKEDYDKIPKDIKIDKISPHSCILFSERHKSKYLIDNSIFSQEIEVDQSKKGTYDLFKAFAVEEITITLNLFIDGDITADTFKKVKKDYKRFVADLYWQYIIEKRPCSYALSGFDDAMGIFYSKKEIRTEVFRLLLKKIITKIVRD